MMTAKTVREMVDSFSCFELDGMTLEKTIAHFAKLVKNYGPAATIDYGQHNRYDDSYLYAIYRTRPETEEEKAQRLATEKVNTESQRKHDEREFARLKAKLEKGK